MTVLNIRRDAVGEILSTWGNYSWVKWDTRELPMTELTSRLVLNMEGK